MRDIAKLAEFKAKRLPESDRAFNRFARARVPAISAPLPASLEVTNNGEFQGESRIVGQELLSVI
jgi:hypothetical protein